MRVESEIKTNNKYAYYYFTTGEMKLVSKVAFVKSSYPVIKQDDMLIKLVSPQIIKNKKNYLYLFHHLKHMSYKPESLLTEIGDTWTVCRHFMKLCSALMNVKDKVQSIGMVGIVSILELFLSLNDIFSQGFSMTNIVKLSIRLCDVLGKTVYKPEMLEELVLSTAMALNIFPKPVKQILVNLQLLTANKICEDITIMHKILQYVIELIKVFLQMLPTHPLVDKVAAVIDSFLDNSLHGQLKQMIEELSRKDINDLLITSVYREKILGIYSKLDHLGLKEWGRRSVSVTTIYSDFLTLYKRVLAINENSRVEPVAFVFEGPPGCGKSHAMSRVVEAFQMGSYCHTVKCTKDGKDFYDGYNNEPIFYMDDLGQQGNSQWRTMINMVSEVKYPLDCAKANLKDTKFFNSEIILATTNAFMNFPPLTKDDCITDITALWRRCFVFDFSGVRFQGGLFTGVAYFRHYPVGGQGFKLGLPNHYGQEFEKLCPRFKFEFQMNGNNLEFFSWMYKIIFNLNKIAKNRHVANLLSQDDINLIRGDAMPEALWNLFSESTDRLPDMLMDLPTFEDRRQEFRDLYVRTRNRLFSYSEESRGFWIWIDILKEILTDVIGTLTDYIVDKISEFGSANTLYVVLILLVGMGALYIFNKGPTALAMNYGSFIAEGNVQLRDSFTKEMSTVDQAIVRNLREVRLDFGNGKVAHCIGLFSGHSVVIPCHGAIEDEGFLTTYTDKTQNHIMYDKIKFQVIYRDYECDTAVLRLPRTLASVMRDISNLIGNKQPSKTAVLLSPFGVYSKVSAQCIPHSSPIVYPIPVIGDISTISISGDCFTYPLHGNGLCGSIVSQGGIVGMHVAGSDSKGLGLSVRWSEVMLEVLRTLLKGDEFVYPSQPSERILKDMSVLKLEETKPVSVGSSSNIVPTHLYGIYPVEREPANLVKFGRCTVKDVAKKSFAHTAFISPKHLNFGKDVVRRFLKHYIHTTLSPKEIIKGTAWLAGLNKDSSNGYKCLKLKSDYIDFESDQFRDFFKIELEIFENGIRNGKPDWDKMVWTEALKDELRNVEKEGVPRSFRVGTIHHQVLMKKYFGSLVEHLMADREFNNIMVGINPFVEWPKMYQELCACKGIFAGDIAKWDGSMNNMVQDAIKEVILEFMGDDVVCDFLLENAIRSLVSVQDDTYITTHSMPSGHYLTAILNSLVNRFYSAIWYNQLLPENSVSQFLHDVLDYVYGDDKLVGIRANTELLNAITMRNFFENIGLGFTDALKKPITQEFQDIGEVTFLKRYFRYHNELNKIVCPLELKTLCSGLSYYDSSKDYATVLKDKINAFQREIYLWPERDLLLSDFISRMNAFKTSFTILSKEYLKELYTYPEDEIMNLLWGGSKYI